MSDVLARSFLAGEPTVEQMVARAGRTLAGSGAGFRPLAQRYVEAIAGRTRPRHRDVVRFLLDDRGFRRARSKYFHELAVAQWITGPQRMQPVPGGRTWDVPRDRVRRAIWPIGSRLMPGELEWFADFKGLDAARAIGRG